VRTTTRSIAVLLVSCVAGALVVVPATAAGGGAPTKVTIKTENGDFWGRVVSPRPLKCADERKVTVFRQVGSEQDPRVDERIASDTASLNGDVYEWNTGNTGQFGKFYARVKRTPDCQADTSPTVRSRRT
jgi:hypothetical protein